MAHIVTLRKTKSPSSNIVSVGTTELLFSYETIVAYRTSRSNGWKASENIWSQTTGKHLNEVSLKGQRIEHDEWFKGLCKALEAL